MNFDALRRRRATYQRSKTLGSLPLHLIHQVQLDHRRGVAARDSAETRTTIAEELDPLSPIADSPVHVLSAETLRPSTAAGSDVSYLGGVSPVGDGPSHVYRPSTSPRRRPSPSDFAMAHPAGGGQGDLGPSKRSSLERSRSISAVLFTKVKDRIVEKMFQTATEGPQLAAIVQERRQRAADEYEARLQTGAGLLKGHRKDHQGSFGLQVDEKLQFSGSSNIGSSRRIRGSLGSSPIKELPITEEGSIGESETHERIRNARVAFRRRSISQDAAQMGMLLLQPNAGSQSKPRTTGSQNLHSSGGSGGGSQNLTVSASGSQNFEGIVCSNDDFQAIVKMGQMAMQSGRAPSQKPRLSFRALSFNHGSFAPAASRQSGELYHARPRTDSNSNVRIYSDDELFAGVDGGADTTLHSTNQPPTGTTTTTVESASRPSSLTGFEDLSRTAAQSISTTGASQSTTAATLTTATTRATSRATATTTVGVVSDVEGRGVDARRGSPTTTTETTAAEAAGLATVPEIEYDENGQTWDVYGAEFDPEILGDAIQVHLKRLIERRLLDLQQQQQQTMSSQENSPSPLVSDLASTRRRNDELKLDRKRSYRPEVKKRGDDDAATNSIFRYLCIFSKRRHSSDETI